MSADGSRHWRVSSPRIYELLPLLTSLINISLITGVFPEQCKNAIIRPLLKNNTLDPEKLKNFRTVSNLYFVSKILERGVKQRLEEHLNEHSLHDPLKSAYREGHSTETTSLKISNDITGSLDIGGCVVLASLDVSAAFDTVDYDILLQRFQSVYGINVTCYSWFKSYLEHMTLKVNVHSSYPKPQQLKCRVLKGSVLGARIYSTCMYVHPMSGIARQHHISYHNYADDTQLYISCDNNAESIREAISLFDRCISDICKWTGNNY